jgi:hypothetical protein
MTMGLSLTQPARATQEITAEDRMERLGGLAPSQLTEALMWLSGYAPATFDAVIDAVEPCPGDGTDDPAPFCERCGADIGVFLKFGLDWRHYRGTTLRDIELFDPGHASLLAWRMTATTAV